MRYGFRCVFTIVLGLTLASAAWAQWSSDPSKNLALADRRYGNDQVQPKVRPLANNGWYVSWFDANPHSKPPLGYSVFLQRLNAGGVEKFRHDGIEVAHLGNSSTEDYGLDVDTKATLCSPSSTLAKESTSKSPRRRSAPPGKLSGESWVCNSLEGSTASNAAPKIAGTSDGDVVVAWTQ